MTEKKNQPSKPRKKFKVDPLTRHRDLPATVGLVTEVRLEVLSEIRGVNARITGLETKLEARIAASESKLDARITCFDGGAEGRKQNRLG